MEIRRNLAWPRSAALTMTRALLAPGLACLLVAEALAQMPSSPEAAERELLRQQEYERTLRRQREQTPDVRLDRPETLAEPGYLPVGESPCFRIDRVLLRGEAAERFQWALAATGRARDGKEDAPAGRCLGARGINRVMTRVQNAIVHRGFVTTRVVAAPQDLSGGTLELTLIPGRIGAIRFIPGTDGRATQWNAVPARPGELLDLRDIEQALENYKRVPTAEADIQIAPAAGADARPGESDVIIAWQQDLPFRLALSADDSGTKATGKYLGAVTLSYDHWWTLNDLFYLTLSHDLGGGDPGRRGTRGYVAYYSLPFGYWLLGFTGSGNRYHQSVAGASQTYLYSGESRNAEIRLSRLIYRDATRKSVLSLAGWTRSSRNFIDDTEVEVQRRRVAGWDLGLAHREFIGTAMLDLSLNYRRGTGAMDALPAPEEAFGEGTSRPKIFTAGAQLNLPFSIGARRVRYGATWRGQWNRISLVPQDRFAIGSRYTVRGFDGENLLSAERGWLLRNDLGWTLGQMGQELYLGLDHGEVGGASSQALIGTRLTGAVLGLRGGYKGLAYDLFAGRPIHKPEGFKTAGRVAGFNVIWSL